MSTKILYYKTDQGILASLKVRSPESVRINEKPIVATFHPDWWLITGEEALTSFSIHAGTKPVNERYVLVNDAVQGLEPVIAKDDVERDENGGWSGKHKGLDTLYRYERDLEDLGFKEQPFEPDFRGDIDLERLGDPTAFSYKLHGERDRNTGDSLGYKDIFSRYDWMEPLIGVDDIAKAMTPDVAWHLYPCSVGSTVAYRIIRSFVKDHIDPRFAEVTSDYDFCFTVKKKIRIIPYIRKWEVTKDNGKSFRPPRFSSKQVEYELHEIFEMTHSGHPYRGYTLVEGFKGESLAELAENIDRYLSQLMEVINAPLARCHHCEGKGIMDLNRIPTNDRAKFGREMAA